jgi:hypothetical protein
MRTRFDSACSGFSKTFQVSGRIAEGTRARDERPERSHASPTFRVAASDLFQFFAGVALSVSTLRSAGYSTCNRW